MVKWGFLKQTNKMNKKIALSYKGEKAQVGFISVVRSLPNRYVDSVGHFVFLDQMPLKTYPTSQLQQAVDGIKEKSAHPHRGIATFSYVMRGTIEHNDSRGNYGIVDDGGIQWMKAGNGIIHDEIIIPSKEDETTQFGMQFWINLPAKNKSETPDYIAIQGKDVPTVKLENNIGNLKILIGEFEGEKSKIPTYSKQFLYHIELNSNQDYILQLNENDETALIVANGNAVVNNEKVSTSEMLVFDKQGTQIKLNNPTKDSIDILVFGGEPYSETIAFGGSYVMNSQQEIAQANSDYYNGKYGAIKYKK